MKYLKLYKLQRKLIYRKYGYFAFFALLPHQFRLINVTNLQSYAFSLKLTNKIYTYFLNLILDPLFWSLTIILSFCAYFFALYENEILFQLESILETFKIN